MKNVFNRALRRRMLAAVLALAIFEAGCFGSFRLTQAVWKFNKGISHDKFVQWLFFLVLVIVPVYGLATLADALVVNSIEFWSGRNPVNADGTRWEKEIRLADGTTARMIAEDEDTLRVEHGDSVMRLRRSGEGIVALDEEGRVLSMVREADGGALERVDADGRVHRIEAWQLAAAGTDVNELARLAEAAR